MCYNGITKRKEEKEMVAKVCIHPIKVNKVIKNFIEEVLDSSTFVEIQKYFDESMYYGVWGCFDDEITVFIPNWKIVNYKNDFGGKCFRKDFVNRCTIAKGFSDVTISLLHEIGHIMTESNLPQDYCRW